jgi:tRNA-dihydrouridine synthase 4
MDEVCLAPSLSEWDDTPEARGIFSSPRRQRKVRGCMIVQFAANDGVQLADAAELVKPWVDGIDLNCGGCHLSLQPNTSLLSG